MRRQVRPKPPEPLTVATLAKPAVDHHRYAHLHTHWAIGARTTWRAVLNVLARIVGGPTSNRVTARWHVATVVAGSGVAQTFD
jgi:hypothetical protein